MDKKFHDNSQLSINLKIRDHHDLSNLEEGRWIVTKLIDFSVENSTLKFRILNNPNVFKI